MNNITHRSEQFWELEKMKQDLLQTRGWLLPKTIQDLLVEWFVENETTTNNKQSPKIVEIMERYKQYKQQEPIVQVELSLWKMACLLNPPTLNNNTGSNKTSNENFDAVNYFVRGGWKKNKSALRHDSMIGIVITNVLPFLAKIDYETSCARADYFYSDNDISTVIVSNAGIEGVNGIYTNPHNRMYNDAPIFTKPGTYEGDAVTYSIYKYRRNRGWYISILHTDEDLEDGYYFYYNAYDLDDDKRIPPTDNWVTCDQDNDTSDVGIHPPPLIIPLKK